MSSENPLGYWKRGIVVSAFVLVCFQTALAQSSLNEPKIIFTKKFPQSSPSLMEIELDRQGRGTYRDDESDQVIQFHLPAEITEQVFQLAEQLNWFREPLESKRKVAFTGEKTFRFVNDQTANEVSFNYSDREEARQLLSLFEKIGETQRLYALLDRSLRHDKLGVFDVLLKIEIAFRHGRLIGYDVLLPLLQKIRDDSSVIQMARRRAQHLIAALEEGSQRSQQ